VEGLVTDASGLPIPGALVAVTPPGHVATTGDGGRFCFVEAPEGTLTLTAELDGFRTHQLRAVRSPDTPLQVTFRLTPEFTDAVVVTGTRTGRRLDEVPVRTELIDRAAIDRVGARTLADAVEFTTGVRVENNCQNCNFSQIRLLGLEGPYTQILIDGQPVISSLAQVYGIEQLPARMIERIEVVKGGGSALYGPGSVGGVINVISREPGRSGGIVESRAELVGGLPNYAFNGAADWVDGTRQTSLTGFAQTDRVKPVDLTRDGFTDLSRRNLDTAGVRFARYALANRAKLTIDATRMTEDRRGGNLLRLAPHEADIAESIESRRHAGSATWFHTVSRRFDYRGTVAIAAMNRDSYYGTGADPNAYGRSDNLLGVFDTQLNHYVRRHTLSWGMQASSESLEDRQPAYGRFLEARYRNVGLFIQDDWTVADGWQIVLGVRADRHSAVQATIASPRVALMISPRENLDIRMSVARGFRAPQVFDEDLHLSSVGGKARIIHLSPDLREETATNLLAGVEWKPEVGRGQALVEINGFHTSLNDLFHVREADDPATAEFEFLKANFGGASVFGVELNLGWGIGEVLILQGGLVEQRARFGEPDPDFGERDFFRTPRRYGNLSAVWRHPGIGELFLGARVTGSMKAPHYAGYIEADRLDTTAAFTTIDASIARPLYTAGDQRVVLTVRGRNLTDAFQRDLDQGPLRDSAYVYGPRAPRSVSVALRVEF
jgi:outer membrane receptor for ferrienterochelin and colicins